MTQHRQTPDPVRSAPRRAVGALRRRLRGTGGRDDLETRLTWVSGSPRTGSTWLLNLVGIVTGAVRVDEPLIGAHLATPTSTISGRPLSPDDPLIVDEFAGRADYFFSEQHAAVWVPALRRLVLDRLQSSVGARGGVPVVVKEPNGARGLPVLLRALPASRLLFLVRDGRDVVDSFLDGADDGWISDNLGVRLADYGGREGLLRIRAAQWVREIDAVQRCYDAHAPARRLLLRYEDLRAEPVAELARVVTWLGHPGDEGAVAEAVDTLDVDRVAADRRGSGKFVRSATPGAWTDAFSETEVALLNETMGPTLARLGYA